MQVLLPRFDMDADPEYDPEEDWLDDNKGEDSMAYPNFFDAMFELADMWWVGGGLGRGAGGRGQPMGGALQLAGSRWHGGGGCCVKSTYHSWGQVVKVRGGR